MASKQDLYRRATVMVLQAYGCPMPVRTIVSEINTRYDLAFNPRAISCALQSLKKDGIVQRHNFSGSTESWELKANNHAESRT